MVKIRFLNEVYSEKQRRWACAQMNNTASERPEGLSKAEAEEMCKSEIKKEEIDELYALPPKTSKDPDELTMEDIQNIIEEEIEAVIDEKRKKAGTESSKESSLRDWFGRKGAKGKKGGWVDCNAPDGKGGYKACGREKGEKRKKYPACRPTPGACKERGKGKSWGKKAKKGKKG